MNKSQPCCLVKGSINIDDFFHLPHIVRPGETISSRSVSRKPGGKGANEAYALAKAGASVKLDGYVGEDGVWVKQYLQDGGVDVSRLNVIQEEMTGRAIIQLSDDGDNSIVLHKGANYFSPADESSPSPDLDGITHLLLQNEIPLSTTIAYLRAAGERNIISVFNPSPMLTPDEMRQIPWSDLHVLIVNEGELRDLLQGLGISSPTADDNDQEGRALEEEMKSLGEHEIFHPRLTVICTLGSKGVIWLRPQEREVGGYRVHTGSNEAGKLEGPVKDTTGAGDCFAGFFVAGLMRLGPKMDQILEECLAVSMTPVSEEKLTGDKACAHCVEREGAMASYPTRDEVLARIDRLEG